MMIRKACPIRITDKRDIISMVTEMNWIMEKTAIIVTALNPKRATALCSLQRMLTLKEGQFVVQRSRVRMNSSLTRSINIFYIQNIYLNFINIWVKRIKTVVTAGNHISSISRNKMSKSMYRIGMRPKVPSLSNCRMAIKIIKQKIIKMKHSLFMPIWRRNCEKKRGMITKSMREMFFYNKYRRRLSRKSWLDSDQAKPTSKPTHTDCCTW